MIDYIKVNNFRTFGMNGKPAEFNLAPITILTGTNSSGKSSLIKLLQLLKANVPNNYSSLMEPDFRKGDHKLFSMQNVMNQQGEPLDIEIKFVNNTESYSKKSSDFQKPLSLITKLKDSINNDKKGLLEEFIILEDDIKIFNVSYFYPESDTSVVKRVKPPENSNKVKLGNDYFDTIEGELTPYHEEMINNGGEVEYYHQDEIYKMRTFFGFKNTIDKSYPFLNDHFIEKDSEQFIEIPLDESFLKNHIFEEYIGVSDIVDYIDTSQSFKIVFNLNDFIKNGLHEGDISCELIIEPEKYFEYYELIMFPDIKKIIIDQIDYDILLDTGIKSKQDIIEDLSKYVVDVLSLTFNLWEYGRNGETDIMNKTLSTCKNNVKKIYEELNKITNLNSFRGIPERFLKQSEPLSDLDKALSNLQSDEKKKDNIERWLLEFGLDKDIEVKAIESIGSYIKIIEKNESRSLVDVGFGYSQLLPILILSQYSKILMVEEPEAHLHPNFQSILADFFSKMIDEPFNTSFGKYTKRQFVLETHSEYMIRKFQYLVAKRELKPEDIVIYFFGTDPTKEDYIREIRINEYGQLSSDFGEGFMDEASRLITYLWDIDRDN
jgi:predicted ATPase